MPAYAQYLALDELLRCQRPLSDGPEHDELLFIVIHQVYELWFKQLLHEHGHLVLALEREDGPRAAATLKRMLTILKVQVAQVDILETMTPTGFLSFRDRLEQGSGFQSAQFRELEFALGVRDRARIAPHRGTPAEGRLEAWLSAPSLWDHVVAVLARRGFPVPRALLDRDRSMSNPLTPELHPVLLDIYRNHPELAQMCERLVDLDEGLQEWRYRHVKMVERTIGAKHGTGGSTGAAYLRGTLFQPLFPDLWAIRSQL